MSQRRGAVAKRYELLGEIGTGGGGTVFRAHDRRTGGTVAVKIMHSYLRNDGAFAERFRREATIARSLSSPRVARVLDFGVDDGDPFIVMEYIDGVTLDELLQRRGRLSPGEVVSIFQQVAEALAEAHAKGVVHRDIKPSNLKIRADGSVKVLDFGIARAAAMTTVTLTGAFVGSVHYLAPEQTLGRVDIRSDIYSLGVVGYQMLAGRPPFQAEGPWAVVRMHLEVEPDSLAELCPDLPEPLRELVERCLKKQPEDRFQSPAALLSALGGVAVEPVVWKERRPWKLPTLGYPFKRLLRMNRLQFAAGAAMLLVFASIGGIFAFGHAGKSDHVRVVTSPGASQTGLAQRTGTPSLTDLATMITEVRDIVERRRVAANAEVYRQASLTPIQDLLTGAALSLYRNEVNRLTSGGAYVVTRPVALIEESIDIKSRDQVTLTTSETWDNYDYEASTNTQVSSRRTQVRFVFQVIRTSGTWRISEIIENVLGYGPAATTISAPTPENTNAGTDGSLPSHNPPSPTPAASALPQGSQLTFPTATPVSETSNTSSGCLSDRSLPDGWSISGSGTWCRGVDPGSITAHSSTLDSQLLYQESYTETYFAADVTTPNREASLVFRVQDAGNEYLVVFEPDGLSSRGGGPGGIWLIRVVNYQEEVLGSASPSLPWAGTPGRLQVSAVGSEIKVFFNSSQVIDVTDSTFGSGRVGFRIYGDSSVPCDAAFANYSFTAE